MLSSLVLSTDFIAYRLIVVTTGGGRSKREEIFKST